MSDIEKSDLPSGSEVLDLRERTAAEFCGKCLALRLATGRSRTLCAAEALDPASTYTPLARTRCVAILLSGGKLPVHQVVK